MARASTVVLSFLAAVAAMTARDAPAAEDVDVCTAFIDSLPAVVGAPGYYCLRRDVATPSGSGEAILVTGDDITIDCNGFKIGGLAAGSGTATTGIAAGLGVRGSTVRRCTVRGFRTGISLWATGALVEDNRLDGNTEYGIVLQGRYGRVRRNQVFRTGGTTYSANYTPVAIWVGSGSEVADNFVSGVRVHAGAGWPIGIRAWDSFAPDYVLGSITGNRITGLESASGTRFYAIHTGPGRGVVSGNQLLPGAGPIDAGGVLCNTLPGTGDALVRQNTLSGFSAPILSGCVDGGGNVAPAP